MKFTVLASGSRANCTAVQTRAGTVLIDCGLSARETLRRLNGAGIPAETVSAVIVTHEHRDHIAGISVLSRRLGIPVYAAEGAAPFLEGAYAVEVFWDHEPFSICGLEIIPFAITHDAADPVGYVLREDGVKLVYATDLGRVTDVVRAAARGCHALILEFNHDLELLRECAYPWPIKQRIASNHGHLSNGDAAGLVAELLHDDLAHLVLGHISENSNTPRTAMAALAEQIDTACLASCRCASPYQMTPLLAVEERRRRRVA